MDQGATDSMAGVDAPDARPPTTDREVLAGQKRALELALHGAPLAEVLDTLVRTIEAHSRTGLRASILLMDDDGRHLLLGAAPSLPAAYNQAIHGVAIGPEVGSCGTAAFTRETVVVEDIETDPRWAAYQELARAHGLRACWSTPILSSTGAVLGTFALYHGTVAVPAAADQELVELLGSTAALVIERDLNARQRERAEAALRDQAERQLGRLAALFEHAPAAIAVLRGPEHVFEVANPAYQQLVGGRPLLGRTVRAAFPELAGQGLYEVLDNVQATGVEYVGRSQRVMLAGAGAEEPAERFFNFVYQPMPDPAGRAADVFVLAFDVSDHVRAQRAAEEALARAEASEHILKTFIDNLPELAWTALPDGHIDYYNQRWYDYTGTTFEEMQGWGWEKVHDPLLLPKVVERWQRSLATGEPFEMEFTLRGADGVARWFLTRVAPSRDAAGRIVRWFGTNTNIDVIRASQALLEAVADQSREMQAALLAMRHDKDRAVARVAELERDRPSGTR